MQRVSFHTSFLLPILILAIGFTPQSIPAQNFDLEGYDPVDKTSVFKQANEFYRQEEYQKALKGYLYLHNLGIKNGYLSYNLGNTYFSLGELGKAILWYERAKRYLPRFEDLQVNYEYARQNLADDEFRAPEYTGTIGLLLDLHNMLNLRETFFVLCFFFWLFILATIIMLWTGRENIRSRLRIPCWLLLFAVILFSLSLGLKIYRYEYKQEAIVMQSAVDVKTGPGSDLSVLFTIHEGTKVILAQEQDNWRRIYMPGNRAFTGWLPKSAIEKI